MALSATAATLAPRAVASAWFSARHLVKHVFAYRILSNAGLKCPRPQNGGRSGRAETCFCPPFPFFEGGRRGGCACDLGRWRHPAGGIGRLGPALSALPARRLAGGGGDGRLATALGSVVASSGLCPRTAVGSARWLQAAGGSATGGR